MIRITLFFAVGAISHMTHKKYMHQINGLGKKMPITFVCFTIAAVSLVGIPPTNGFVSKWFLGVGALDAYNLFYVFILLLSAFFTAGYLFSISVTAFFVNEKHNPTDHVNVDESNEVESLDPTPFMLVPIIILTVTIAGLGIFPNIVINFLGDVIADAF